MAVKGMVRQDVGDNNRGLPRRDPSNLLLLKMASQSLCPESRSEIRHTETQPTSAARSDVASMKPLGRPIELGGQVRLGLSDHGRLGLVLHRENMDCLPASRTPEPQKRATPT